MIETTPQKKKYAQSRTTQQIGNRMQGIRSPIRRFSTLPLGNIGHAGKYSPSSQEYDY
jgi:hypothetical protein